MKQSELEGRKSAIKKIMQMVSEAMDKGAVKDVEGPGVAKVEVVKVKAKPVHKDSEHEIEDEDSEWSELPDEDEKEVEEKDWKCSDCQDGSCVFCKMMA